MANERRKAIFEQLKEEGKLDKPYSTKRGLHQRPKMARKKKVAAPPKPVEVKPKCCIDRYGDKLPSLFKMCADCPKHLTEPAASDTVSPPV